jgi:signal transduction histidine kinase
MTSAVTSLRLRIFLGTSVALTLVVLIGAVALWLAAQAVLYRELDDTLRERARTLGSRVAARPDAGRPPRPPPANPGERPPGERPLGERPPGERLPGDRRPGSAGPFAGPPGIPPEMRADGGTIFIQVLDADGREVARSPSLADGESLQGLVPPNATTGRIISTHLGDHRPLRLTVEHLPPSFPGTLPPWLVNQGAPLVGERPHTLLVAIDAGPVVSDLRRLGVVLVVLWLVTTALGIAVALWLHRTILRPLRVLSHGIAAIGPDDLRARLSAAQVPREMQVVPQRLNELLSRLESAFLREKSTLANLAHELRTPITGLRMTLELALADQPPPAQATALTTCLRITESMQGMITNLLMLARLDAGQQGLPTGDLHMEEAARSAWAQVATRASERRLQVHWQIAADVDVRATAEQAQMMIGNLLDNAVSYATQGSTIVIGIDAQDSHGRLVVENHSESEPADITQVFVPFWRGDQARTGGLHCGLGLALVHRLAHALGGTVVATLPGDRRFRICLRLPLVGMPAT